MLKTTLLEKSGKIEHGILKYTAVTNFSTVITSVRGGGASYLFTIYVEMPLHLDGMC